MALFQKSVIKTYLKLQDTDSVQKAYKKYTKYFHNTVIQENIKGSKEEQFQAKFLDELFVNILGYTMNPKPDYNLTTEFKNQKNNRKADGALLVNGKAVGVIELKGTNTKDLESIRKQAFDYKANQKDCVYVVTSNFEKLRFYINDATEFEEFNLFMVSEEEFALLYLCLQKDNVLSNLPLKIKEESIIQEEQITKKFYADYSLFKRELFRDLVKQNVKRIKNESVIARETKQSHQPSSNDEDIELKQLEKNVKLALFKKSQKLIDRFLFVFFAEDRSLLPANSTAQILNKWKADIDFGDNRPLYDLFKQYFNYLDSGRKGTTSRAEIYAYNGGLFKPDSILDNLVIDDQLLYKHTLKLATYDFESQVDVNILGHIFENSLNEIESVNAEIEGAEFDKQKSKRKKDGVFYTPKYITKYIVENTVGKLCEEKKVELGFQEEEYFKSRTNRPKKKLQELVELLDRYRDWLLQLTICDPACGSGAFLNQALDFLIKEHRYIDELKANVLGGGLVFSDIENTILENNIYGVDLNEESVEIAKLSLWLRTAQPRRKLNDLNSNIKCGNSLIDDKKVAGDKAFNWQQQFPHIFKQNEKKAFHITTAIHDSRTSDRMVKYKVREKRAMGTNPYPNVIYFTEQDDLVITQTIAEIVKEDKLKVLAYNICADHIHLLVVCDEADIPMMMQKVKGRSSRVVKGHSSNTDKGLKSLDALGAVDKPLWAQKYYAKPVTTETHLHAAIDYIAHNRAKHELPDHSRAIHNLIDGMCCTYEEAFKEDIGGFDVVIGNPPYVNSKEEMFSNAVKDFFISNYMTSAYQIDLYILFLEKSIKIISENGISSLIVPNSWLNNLFLENVRKFFLTNSHINEIVSMPSNTFMDANVDTVIVTFSNFKNKSSTNLSRCSEGQFEIFGTQNQIDWLVEKNSIINVHTTKEIKSIFKKITENSIPLESISDIGRGVGVYHKRVGHTKDLIAKDPYQASEKLDETFLPYLRGRNVQSGYLNWNKDSFISYGNWLAEPREPKFFTGERIVLRQIPSKRLIVSYLKEDFVIDQSVFIARFYEDSKYSPISIASILGSKLLSFYFRFYYSEFDDLFPKVKLQHFKQFPISKNLINLKGELKDKSVTFSIMNNDLNELTNKFQRTLQRKFAGLDKLSKKLESWYELSYAEFIKELGKKKIKLSLAEEAEWEDYFTAEQQKAVVLKAQIDQTDREIDAMVYELYGLTEEEIKIVEQS